MADQVTTCSVESRDGTQIAYMSLGSGPPVAVVHGAWASSEDWLDVARRMGTDFACHVMDRRARGGSQDGADYRMAHEVEDILAVLENLGPDACLFGHSSGAIYALEAARRAPVARLVLYEPPLCWRGPTAEALLDRFRAEVEAGRLDAAATLFFREEARLPDDALSMLRSTPHWARMTALAWTCIREWDAILDADLSIDRYRDVSSPTLLLAGTDTLDHPSFATKQLAEVVPHSQTAMLDGQGHMAHRNAPELVADAVRSFLTLTS